MKKLFLLIPLFAFAVMANAAIPELTKSTPLTLTAATEGFSQSDNAKALEDGEWINWSGGTIQDGFAKWRVNIADPGVYSVTLDMKSTNTYEFRVCALNPLTNDTIVKCFTEHQDRGDYSNTELPCLQKLNLFAKEAGEYDIIVTDMVQWSTGKVRGLTLSFESAPLTTAPATLIPDDALLSARAWVDKSGAVDSILFTPRGSEGYNLDEWVKWAVEIPEAGYYDFTANTYRASGQKFEITLLNQDESATLISNDNGGSSIGSGNASISTGKINLAKGIYVLRVRNIYKYADSRLLNAVVTYAGGKTIAVPDTLWPVDALKSEYAFVNEDGELRFTDNDHTGYVPDQYGKWNIHLNKGGLYNFTLNAFSSNSHHYYLYILNTDESQIEKYTLDGSSGQVLNATTTNRELAAGDYIIKIENFTQYSYGRVRKIIANYEGGAVVNVPGQILAEDALIKAEAGKTSKMIHQANGDIEYKANASQLDEYAEWNLHATEAGEMEVSFNSPSEGHQFRFELYQSETLIGYVEESAASWTHDVTLTDHLTIPAVGDYTLKLINKQQYSLGVLHSVTFTPYVAPAAVTMSDTDTDNSAWVANVGGAACNVTLNRTILGGMFNAICLPFALTGSQVKAAFGNDVELYYLSDASIDNGVLNLEFGVANDIYQGTPYLIKTSSNVTNPTFNGVSIVLEEASSTFHTGWPVSFKGTFVSTTIAANGQNLLIYSDNQVGFPESDKTLKGFRAYFHLSSPSLAPSIQHARLITPNNAPMDIDFVESQESAKSQKLLRDGQLIILRDGVQYNVMGVKLQ